MQLKEGNIFDNRYRLISILDRGGFSEVWLVEDTKVENKKVALKIYVPGIGLDEDGEKLFSKEFGLIFELNHSYLLKPQHFDVNDRSPYLVMPYCEKGSASGLVGNITEEDAWRFLHNVASGLVYLQKQNPPIIHQDIKPNNILIDREGNFLITDFGISTRARSTLRNSVRDASPKTVAYSPPERFGKDNSPVMASDIWSLGATLFELMTGEMPFGEYGGLDQKSGNEIPDINGNYSETLKTIVYKMLAPQPWDRPLAKQLVEWVEKHNKRIPIEFEQVNPNPHTTQRITGKDSIAKIEPTISPTQTKKSSVGKYIIATIGIALIVLAAVFFIPRDKDNHIVEPDNGSTVLISDTIPQSAETDEPTIITDISGKNQLTSSKKNEPEPITPNNNTNDEKSTVATYLRTNPTVLSFDADGSRKTVTVSTDGSMYEVTNLPSWCLLENKGSTSFQIVVARNTGTERNGTITVRSGSSEVRINVNQDQASQGTTATYLRINPTELIFTAEGARRTITVSTDGNSYEVINLPSWCELSNKASISFQIVVARNSTGEERSGTITVRSGGREVHLSVKQEKGGLSRQAYSEAYAVLLALGNEYINKIAKDVFEYIKSQSDPALMPYIDQNKGLDEQGLSKDCIAIMAWLRLNYFCETEEERQQFLDYLKTSEKELKEIILKNLNLYHQFDKNLGTSYQVVQRKSDGKWGIINTVGEVVVDFIYTQSSSRLKNGCYALMDEQKKWHVFDPSLKKIASGIDNLNNYE